MAPVVKRVPKPPVVNACSEGAALGVVVGVVDGVVLGVSPSPLLVSSPTVLLLTMLLSVSSVVNDAVMLLPLVQAVGVSVVPATNWTAEHWKERRWHVSGAGHPLLLLFLGLLHDSLLASLVNVADDDSPGIIDRPDQRPRC